MIEISDSQLNPESSSLNRNLLEYAWEIYTIYDPSAIKIQVEDIFKDPMISDSRSLSV